MSQVNALNEVKIILVIGYAGLGHLPATTLPAIGRPVTQLEHRPVDLSDPFTMTSTNRACGQLRCSLRSVIAELGCACLVITCILLVTSRESASICNNLLCTSPPNTRKYQCQSYARAYHQQPQNPCIGFRHTSRSPSAPVTMVGSAEVASYQLK